MLYGKDFDLSHLRVFGCLCSPSTLPRVDKLAPGAKKASMMGYLET